MIHSQGGDRINSAEIYKQLQDPKTEEKIGPKNIFPITTLEKGHFMAAIFQLSQLPHISKVILQVESPASIALQPRAHTFELSEYPRLSVLDFVPFPSIDTKIPNPTWLQPSYGAVSAASIEKTFDLASNLQSPYYRGFEMEHKPFLLPPFSAALILNQSENGEYKPVSINTLRELELQPSESFQFIEQAFSNTPSSANIRHTFLRNTKKVMVGDTGHSMTITNGSKHIAIHEKLGGHDNEILYLIDSNGVTYSSSNNRKYNDGFSVKLAPQIAIDVLADGSTKLYKTSNEITDLRGIPTIIVTEDEIYGHGVDGKPFKISRETGLSLIKQEYDKYNVRGVKSTIGTNPRVSLSFGLNTEGKMMGTIISPSGEMTFQNVPDALTAVIREQTVTFRNIDGIETTVSRQIPEEVMHLIQGGNTSQLNPTSTTQIAKATPTNQGFFGSLFKKNK